jgi:hypothetical protein
MLNNRNTNCATDQEQNHLLANEVDTDAIY